MNADHKNDICKNNPNNSANKKTLKEALPWSKLGNVDVIKKWSEEIKLAVRQKSDADEWALVGHAVTIIHDDIEDCKNVLQRIAVDLDFEFACFDDDAISKSFTD